MVFPGGTVEEDPPGQREQPELRKHHTPSMFEDLGPMARSWRPDLSGPYSFC